MEKIVVWYLRMSVIYFVAGAVIGLAMVISPNETAFYAATHAHLNLLGFMSMMIYGVGYHILPKFSGRNIYSPMIMHIQFWTGNAGLIGMAFSWSFGSRMGVMNLTDPLLMISSLLSLAAVILFSFNILKTIKST